MLSFFFGAVVSAVAAERASLRLRGPFGWAVGFDLVVFVPIGAFFYFTEPDWSWMYFFPASNVPAAVAPLVLAVYPASTALGYVAARAAARAIRPHTAWVVALVALAAIAALSLDGRLFAVGSYAAYHSSGALVPLFKSHLFSALLIAGFILSATFLGLLYWLRKSR